MSVFKTGVFWSNAVMVLYFLFTSLLKVFPSVAWLSTIVLCLDAILTTVFHNNAVTQLASANAKLASMGAPKSTV